VGHNLSTVTSNLLPLKSVGSVNKILCIPGAGATVATFMDLADALSLNWSVFGFQPRGTDLATPPDRSVEDTAQLNVAVLLRTVGSREIHLIGHSYGGWVAYEMARLLCAAGQSVSSLTMIDTEAPDQEDWPSDEPSIWRRFMAALSEQFEVQLGVSDRVISSGEVDLFVRDLHSALRRHKAVSDKSKPAMLKGPLATFTAAFRTKYIPQGSYQLRANLALASEPCAAGDRDSEWKGVDAAPWRAHVADLRVTQVPGNHFSMLRTPNVHVLARWWAAIATRVEL
jgi:arthrofactin-type cyclic lipopeptide synthetase C